MSEQEFKAIIFDKDGTLFHYSEIWHPVLKRVFNNHLPPHLKEKDLDEILAHLGLPSPNEVDVKGILFNKNNFIKWIKAYNFIRKKDIKLGQVKKLHTYRKEIYAPNIELVLESIDFTKVQNLFKALKQENYIISVVTCDSLKHAKLFIEKMGLEPYIDFVAGKDSKFNKKPKPDATQAICKKFNLKPSEVVVVGDSMVDMKFAKKSKVGYTIAVLTGHKVNKLHSHSDVVYDNIFNIYDDKKIFR